MNDWIEPDDGYRHEPTPHPVEELVIHQEEALREILGPYYDLWERKGHGIL